MERQNIQIDLEKEGEAELVTVQHSTSTSALKSSRKVRTYPRIIFCTTAHQEEVTIWAYLLETKRLYAIEIHVEALSPFGIDDVSKRVTIEFVLFLFLVVWQLILGFLKGLE